MRPSKTRSKGGGAGAMHQLLRRLPNVARWLTKVARMRDRKLRPGEMREVRKTLRSLHRAFLSRLRDAGITEAEWPFNRDELGYRSFQAYFYSGAAKEGEGGEADEAKRGEVARIEEDALLEEALPALSLFDTVQFDGHKLDIRVILSFIDQLGIETQVELTRIWILVCLDVVSRAILGYSIVYAPEYDSDDVARALQSCFGTHNGPRFTIPGMSVRKEGGFPNDHFEEAQHPALTLPSNSVSHSRAH